jgi:carbon-monoxide dehydrogenase small subunit
LALDYKLNDLHGSTQVDIDVGLTLSGPIAQFGWTGLITEVANVLVGDFARNLETRISTPDAARDRAPPPVNRLDVLSILIAALRSWLKKFVGRP